jgi:hypothetical protein
MPSQAMQDVIDALRDRQKASASQPPPTLEERRATFAPAGRLHPVPDDVLVTEVTAGGVPAHWLAAPGADPGRVLLFLHGGGYELGSLRSDGERTINCGGRRLGRRRARRRPARGHAGCRGGIARGRRTDVSDGGSDQLGGLDDRARRPGPVLHPRVAPSARLRLPGRG